MNASNEPVLSVFGLKKNYGDLEAVKGIDFQVAPGEIFVCVLERPDIHHETELGQEEVGSRISTDTFD
ncbi:MAG: hypothetical protein Q7U89_06990 [Coriobacteriia bacterium]|nr:hypothetical protein [Coriobacteriia bacterium]